MMTVTTMVIGMMSCRRSVDGMLGKYAITHLRQESEEEATEAPRCENSKHIASRVAET